MPIWARRSLGTWEMVARGRRPRARSARRGLNTETAPHMLRSVLEKTPSFCSSMKFAELSKPLIPNMAAAKP